MKVSDIEKQVVLKSKINLFLLIFYSVFLMALTVFKSVKIFTPELAFLEAGLGGDKLEHLILALLLSFLVWPVVWGFNDGRWLKLRATLFILLLLIFALLLDEFHQFFISSRHFDWQDSAFGVAGLLMGLILRVLIIRFLFSNKLSIVTKK